TTVVAMPNTKPVADCADVIEYVKKKAADGNCINVLQAGSMTRGQQGAEVSDMEGMKKAGCVAVSEDGKSVMNARVCMEAMREAARLGLTVLDHCEDINLVNGGVVNADSSATRFGLPGITNAVEDVIAARDILLARETGAHLHLCHCSTASSVEMVRNAKEHGINVTAEVCPHHFALTSSDIPEVPGLGADPNYKMNPPLRTAEDVEALRRGLSDGTMDVISTDHAPHTAEEKNASILKSPFGIVGLETAAALAHTELVLGGYLTPYQMAEKMSVNPAKILGLDCGDISVGKPADVVIFNPNISYKIDKNKFYSKGKNTPFDGREVTGQVIYTICNGKVVYEEGV
ncbi:MAG: dihydroorotase, partial [Clostridiales bacterium]|nr:dihydroorotase [Clostridiales bacterium]